MAPDFWSAAAGLGKLFKLNKAALINTPISKKAAGFNLVGQFFIFIPLNFKTSGGAYKRQAGKLRNGSACRSNGGNGAGLIAPIRPAAARLVQLRLLTRRAGTKMSFCRLKWPIPTRKKHWLPGYNDPGFECF